MGIDRFLFASRFIRMLDENRQPMFQGTGFVVTHDGKHFLATNAHVLTAARSDNSYLTAHGRFASFAEVRFYGDEGGRETVGKPHHVTLPMFDENKRALWYEHPEHGRNVDIVALPLPDLEGIDYAPIDIGGLIQISGRQISPRIWVTQRVFIVGFPLGIDGGNGNAAVWAGATIATEPQLNVSGRARFLVDGATRAGLSGAPVYARWAPGEAIPHNGGTTAVMSNSTAFVGIYSGRVDEGSDLGFVWKPHLIDEVLRGGVRGDPVGEVRGEPTVAAATDRSEPLRD